jgi:malonate-semialdehyde dehydrogenase (acetylating) / methylmalonate-semialdehyde dehydrogenase
MRIIPHYINGQENHKGQKTSEIFNPATGEIIAKVLIADLDVINTAVEAAKIAQQSWARVPAIKRASILRHFATKIEENMDFLAQIVCLEHGKTINDAKASIQRGLEILHYHCNVQQQLMGDYSHQVSQDVDCHTFYQPLGICVGIAPFNFPVMVPMWMMIPAIATGNAFILKPSEKVPSASLQLVRWLEEVDLPKGVVQCIQGDASTVNYLLNHPDIAAYTAVGSSQAAFHIYTEASRQGKRAHTFGGAKNHAIVMEDANLEQASDAIVSAGFGSAGQRCMAISAVVCVGKTCQEKLTKLLHQRISRLIVGPGNNNKTDIGPVISKQQLVFLNQAIEQGIAEGAKLVVDGRNPPISQKSSGYFIGPCLFTDVKNNMFLYQKELFGPILIILTVDTLNEAIGLINQNQYGNGAVIFTQNGKAARDFSVQTSAGMIGINIPIPVPIVSHPFGGWKQSGFGDHPMHGKNSLLFYTRQKSVSSTWPKPELNTEINLNMPHH